MANSHLKYLIAGTGGVGGSIAAFLSLSGKDVTCIARGEHLAAIRGNGLQLHSDLKGEHCLKSGGIYRRRIPRQSGCYFRLRQRLFRRLHYGTHQTCLARIYSGNPHPECLQNQRPLSSGNPASRCSTAASTSLGFVSGRGEITQMGKIFRLVYGAHRSTIVSRETLEAVQRDLQESGIKAEISDDINRDAFVKWSFISAMAVTGAYYDVPMGEVQKPGKVRDTFIGLSQSAALGRKLGIEFKEDIVQYNLKLINKLAPESTASMQKDMAKGHQSNYKACCST